VERSLGKKLCCGSCLLAAQARRRAVTSAGASVSGRWETCAVRHDAVRAASAVRLHRQSVRCTPTTVRLLLSAYVPTSVRLRLSACTSTTGRLLLFACTLLPFGYYGRAVYVITVRLHAYCRAATTVHRHRSSTVHLQPSSTTAVLHCQALQP